MLLCCLRRNVDWLLVINTSSSSPVKNKRPRLPTTSVNNLPPFVAAKCIALGGRTVHSTSWSQILAENRLHHLHSTPPSGGSLLEYCHDVWYRKIEWFGHPMVKKFWRYIYSFWQNSRTWQTDGQTDTAWRHRPRLHSIARQKLRKHETTKETEDREGMREKLGKVRETR